MAAVVALLLLGPAAQAEDERPGSFEFESGSAELKAKPARPAPVPSYATRFSSRVQFQMETMSAVSQAAEPGQSLQDHFLYEQMSQDVERSVRRETRRAARDYLLHLTAVDRMVDEFLSRKIASLGGGGDGRGGRRAMDFSFGVSHLHPEVEMEYKLGRDKSFKFGVDSQGKVGMRYRDPRLGGNQVGFGFDGRDTFYVDWRIGGF